MSDFDPGLFIAFGSISFLIVAGIVYFVTERKGGIIHD